MVSQEDNRTIVSCHKWDYDIASNADSIVSRFDLVCDRKYLYDLSSLLPVIGSAVVAPLLGLASDRAGRKPVMLACAFGQLLATIGNSFAETYPFFVFTRVLTFVTADVTFLNTFILLHEVTGNARRSLFTFLDTAVPAVVIAPLMHALSLLEPQWMLARAFTVVIGALLLVWCCLQEESPAWLISTRHISRARNVLLLAAKENGIDVAKARLTFVALEEQLFNMDKTWPSAASMENVLDAVKMRRRAISALMARLALDATFIGIMTNDITTGVLWEAANFIAATAYMAAICVVMRVHGIREILSTLMVILSGLSISEATAIFTGQQTMTRLLHAGMKVATTGAMAVTLSYTAETFPTAVRNAGISISHLAGGIGNVVAIAITLLTEPHAGHVFYGLSALTVLLSVAAIQWLPEVHIEKPQRRQSRSALSDHERKAALLASLQSRTALPSRRHT
ncbi:hypothetical protein HPB50_019369 [Hyalomma asiaticum]|uniref:Uncharacterized protein n=1 Tax=Hyalomma asiaticum TaxID=266040 RepID=A0ACB7SJ39_HYAAI|nr:hypothetical protein HPB50_019369 [Hyalomma asiaticum]